MLQENVVTSMYNHLQILYSKIAIWEIFMKPYISFYRPIEALFVLPFLAFEGLHADI